MGPDTSKNGLRLFRGAASISNTVSHSLRLLLAWYCAARTLEANSFKGCFKASRTTFGAARAIKDTTRALETSNKPSRMPDGVMSSSVGQRRPYL